MEQFLNFNDRNMDRDFYPADTEKLFRKNKKRENSDWIYRTKAIRYKTNELGFRAPPMKNIDWKNTIVVFGCSNVFGIGLAEEDTLCHQLQEIIGIPVVNLGIPGSAIDLACFNSFFLHQNFPFPKSIVQIWTSLERYTRFVSKKEVLAGHPVNRDYIRTMKWGERSKIHIAQDKELWRREPVIYYQGSFFAETVRKNKDIVHLHTGEDKARDLMHPGITDNRLAAEKVSKYLIAQGINP